MRARSLRVSARLTASASRMPEGDAAGGGFGNFGGNMTIDSAVTNGTMFYGTPDQVFEQIKRFYHHVGGFGNLLLMGQAGHLDHAETVAGIRCFAREVYPRLQAEFPDSAISGAAETAGAVAGR